MGDVRNTPSQAPKPPEWAAAQCFFPCPHITLNTPCPAGPFGRVGRVSSGPVSRCRRRAALHHSNTPTPRPRCTAAPRHGAACGGCALLRVRAVASPASHLLSRAEHHGHNVRARHVTWAWRRARTAHWVATPTSSPSLSPSPSRAPALPPKRSAGQSYALSFPRLAPTQSARGQDRHPAVFHSSRVRASLRPLAPATPAAAGLGGARDALGTALARRLAPP